MCLAVPGKIMDIAGEAPLGRTARVSFGGILKEVSLACVPQARVGDYVIVHAGLALNILNEGEAARIYEYLRQIGESGEPGQEGHEVS